MVRISPGSEEEFRYLQEWLASSATLGQAIDATEPCDDGSFGRPNPVTDKALSRPIDSLRITREANGPARRLAPALRIDGRGRNTMWVHLYVNEKLREPDEIRLARISSADLKALISQRPSPFGRLAAVSGRSLRRFGEALEIWATPPGERETLRVALARARRSD